METLRIVMVTTHYPPHHIGGDAMMVKYLSDELASRGHDVHIFRNIAIYRRLRGDRQTIPGNQTNARTNLMIHESREAAHRLSIAESHLLGRDGRTLNELKELIATTKPDVVHWHNTKAFIGTPRPFDSTITAYTAHDYFSICPKSSLVKPDGRICRNPTRCQLCLAKSHKLPQLWRVGRNRVFDIGPDVKVIAPSAFMATRLAADGINAANVIPNFVRDPEVEPCDSSRTELVFIGILEPHKGPDILLDAFASTMHEHGLSLVIIGDGSMKSHLVERARVLGATQRVTVTGSLSRPELIQHLQGAAACVVPSIWLENCPLVALESLALGVPILASRIGGLPEIATKDAGSVTFEPGNRRELGERIVDIWNNPGHDVNLRLRARKAYEEKYSPDKNIKKYLDVLSQCGTQ